MNHLPRIFHLPEAAQPEDKSIHFSPILADVAALDVANVFARMKSV